jgi:hypothetical protein
MVVVAVMAAEEDMVVVAVVTLEGLGNTQHQKNAQFLKRTAIGVLDT